MPYKITESGIELRLKKTAGSASEDALCGQDLSLDHTPNGYKILYANVTCHDFSFWLNWAGVVPLAPKPTETTSVRLPS
jgi:hypothetical protein